MRPYLEKTLHKKKKKKNAGGVAQGVGPEFKSQYRKKKKICGENPDTLEP
jgi:hypothetical protein